MVNFNFKPGDKVVWAQRGIGQRPRFHKATVVKINAKTVTIELTGVTASRRNVDPYNLTEDKTVESGTHVKWPGQIG